MMKTERQSFISGLIRAGFEVEPSGFKEQAMELLGRLIPFDMALWASGHTEGLKVHNFYLSGLPQALMERWEQIKDQDRLLASIIANPGRTLDVFDVYSKEERPELDIGKHAQQFGVGAAISTAVPDPRVDLLDIMSLYRKDPNQPFSPGERAIKQEVFPLMSQVWHHNQIHSLKLSCGGSGLGSAGVCDRQGWVRHAESGFVDLLEEEFPQWNPPVLPEGLLPFALSGDTEKYKGQRLHITRSRQEDLILLQLESRGVLNRLTPREEEVAEAFSSGLTYKEIAAELQISPSTVRTHLESVYRKLEVASKVELVRILNQN